MRAREETDPAAEMERLAGAGVRAVPRFHPGYPDRLREIDDSPPLIYVRGEWLPDDEWSVAVVGTRRATAYGRHAADELARGLAANRVTVVSGLARGVDSIAHRAALDASGRTIAVLASGLDTIYPPSMRVWPTRSQSTAQRSRTTRWGRSRAPSSSRAATASCLVSRWARWWWKATTRAAR